jgi:hypothetical protein
MLCPANTRTSTPGHQCCIHQQLASSLRHVRSHYLPFRRHEESLCRPAVLETPSTHASDVLSSTSSYSLPRLPLRIDMFRSLPIANLIAPLPYVPASSNCCLHQFLRDCYGPGTDVAHSAFERLDLASRGFRAGAFWNLRAIVENAVTPAHGNNRHPRRSYRILFLPFQKRSS